MAVPSRAAGRAAAAKTAKLKRKPKPVRGEKARIAEGMRAGNEKVSAADVKAAGGSSEK